MHAIQTGCVTCARTVRRVAVRYRDFLLDWWAALQGMRERDFTADIPVSVATIAAIAIGQYSAAAVAAALLLVGGMLEEVVAARAGKALDALEKLLPQQVTVRRRSH